MRIVSLVPEAAEILAAIGAGGDVVALPPGDPADAGTLARVLAEARPELIFAARSGAQGGLARPLVRRAVAGLHPRPAVFALEPATVGAILADVKTVGDAVGRQGPARALVEELRARIDAVSLRAARRIAEAGARRVAFLAALDPPLAAGWWQAELIGLAGGIDVLEGVGRPPRPTSWAEIEAAGPELVVRWGDLTPHHAGERGGEVCPGPGAIDALLRLASLLRP